MLELMLLAVFGFPLFMAMLETPYFNAERRAMRANRFDLDDWLKRNPIAERPMKRQRLRKADLLQHYSAEVIDGVRRNMIIAREEAKKAKLARLLTYADAGVAKRKAKLEERKLARRAKRAEREAAMQLAA